MDHQVNTTLDLNHHATIMTSLAAAKECASSFDSHRGAPSTNGYSCLVIAQPSQNGQIDFERQLTPQTTDNRALYRIH